MPAIWTVPVNPHSLTEMHIGSAVAQLGIEFLEVEHRIFNRPYQRRGEG